MKRGTNRARSIARSFELGRHEGDA
jgi:hypothetical protein